VLRSEHSPTLILHGSAAALALGWALISIAVVVAFAENILDIRAEGRFLNTLRRSPILGLRRDTGRLDSFWQVFQRHNDARSVTRAGAHQVYPRCVRGIRISRGPKRAASDGQAASQRTCGLLVQGAVEAVSITCVGKESNLPIDLENESVHDWNPRSAMRCRPSAARQQGNRHAGRFALFSDRLERQEPPCLMT
jgi:hypothetical protein